MFEYIKQLLKKLFWRKEEVVAIPKKVPKKPKLKEKNSKTVEEPSKVVSKNTKTPVEKAPRKSTKKTEPVQLEVVSLVVDNTKKRKYTKKQKECAVHGSAKCTCAETPPTKPTRKTKT